MFVGRNTKVTRTKKFFYNSITTAFYQLVVMIAGFITPRFMLQFYGSEINGLVSSINQFIVYFNLVEAGLSGAAIYALYKPLAEQNNKAISGIVTAAQRFYTQSGYMFVSLTVGLAVIYPFFVKLDVLTPLNVGVLVLILGVNGSLEFFTLSKYRVLLAADQRTYVVSLASIAHIFVNTLIIVILAKMRVNIVVLRFVALLSIFLRSLILMVYVKIKYKFVNYKEEPNTAALNKRWDALYLQILGAIHTGAPVIILTIVSGDLKIVSVYAIFNMIMAGVNGLLSIFISGLSASFGEVIARGEVKTLQKAYKEFEFFYYSLLAGIYSTFFVTIMPFIRIYTNGIKDVNYDLPIIGFLFVLNGLLYNIKTPQGMLVTSAGLFKETRAQTTIQGAIAIILGSLLTPFMGISGVLMGSIASNIYRDIDLLFFVPKNVTKLPIRKSAYNILGLFFRTAIITIPFYFVRVNSNSFKTWVAYAGCAGLYAFLVVIICGLLFNRSDMKSMNQRIVGMIKQ